MIEFSSRTISKYVLAIPWGGAETCSLLLKQRSRHSHGGKNHGVTHTVLEDIGAGAPDRIRIEFKSPEDYGFGMSHFKASNAAALVAAVGYSKSTKAPFFIPAMPAMMCHIIREVPGDIEFRSRFWMEYDIVDRKPKKNLPPLGVIIMNIYLHSSKILPGPFQRIPCLPEMKTQRLQPHLWNQFRRYPSIHTLRLPTAA